MNRSMWFGIVGVIVVLAAGAYVLAQQLTGLDEVGLPAGAQVFEDVYDDGNGNPVTVKTIILPAAELPTDEDGIGGVFTRQEDNSYYVGTGSTSVNVTITNGVPETAVSHSGPEVEVVVNRDTVFYEDITKVSFESSESKEQTLQQVVREIDPPEKLEGAYSISAWGERRGDRVVATTIVISEVQ